MLKLLKAHISKDITRYNLTGAYFHDSNAIGTDGHRLIKIDVNSCPELFSLYSQRENQIHDFNNPLTPITGNYPNYNSLIPSDLSKHFQFNFHFPTWFKTIKTKKELIYIDKNGLHISKPANSDSYLVGINAEYLASYAGYDTEIYLKDSLSPIVIVGQKWTAVVMPVRI